MILLRLNRLELFGLNRMLHTPGKRKKAGALVVLVAVGSAAGLFLIGLYEYMFAKGFAMLGMLDVLPVMLVSIASLTTFITSIFKAPEALYKMRDFDVILSLPVSERTVALARVLKLYSMNLLFTLGVMIPGAVVYGMFAGPGGDFYAAYAICMLLSPLVPVVLAALIGAALQLAGATIKRARYAGLLISFVALMAVMFGSFYLSFNAGSAGRLFDLAGTIGRTFQKIYPLAGLFESAAIGGDWMALIAYAAISLASFGLAVAAFGYGFVRVNTFLNARHQKSGFRLQAQKESSAGRALLRREFQRYFACNIYVLNTAFGLLMSVIMVVALAVFWPKIAPMLAMAVGLGDPVAALAAFVLTAFLGTACTTGSSVSLEGKNLWILKSLPVPAMDWMSAKIRMNLWLSLPCVVICSAVAALVLRPSPLALLTIFLLPISMAVFVAVFGLVFNLKVHSFDWTSEMKVVKQSWGAMLPVLLDMLLCMGGGYLAFQVSIFNHLLIPLCLAGALFFGTGILLFLLRRNAGRWADRL